MFRLVFAPISIINRRVLNDRPWTIKHQRSTFLAFSRCCPIFIVGAVPVRRGVGENRGTSP
jgi:hypothetical protein